jgi:cell division protein FtsL
VTRVNLVLLALVVAAALSLVTARHRAREVFVALEHAQSAARAYDVDYGKLLLEQSTWGMPARVEKIAREQLGMQLPDASRIEVVTTGGAR